MVRLSRIQLMYPRVADILFGDGRFYTATGTGMQPALGWVHLTREDARRAAASLDGEPPGVRDELGLIVLHQAVADKLFPGTSVLHTRLRYAVFVPWLYQDIAEGRRRKSFEDELGDAETRLARRLVENPEYQSGVIGRRVLPRRAASPPSVVYWSALCAWRIVRRTGDAAPARRDVNRILASAAVEEVDDSGVPLRASEPVFAKLPARPHQWKTDAPLGFRLDDDEKRFLKGRLSSVSTSNDRRAMLGILVERGVDPSKWREWQWYSNLRAQCDDKDDRELLRLAEKAAALAAICRAVYAALCEALSDDDGLDVGQGRRDAVGDIVERFRKRAESFAADELKQMLPSLGEEFLTLLGDTATWCAGTTSFEALRGIYEKVEFQRKQNRSKLQRTDSGEIARREADPTEMESVPLHYRWPVVKQLLVDLIS
jgi:hypothetical protein